MKIYFKIYNLTQKFRSVRNFILRFKKKKKNLILDYSNFSENFFRRYLKKQNNHSKEIKEIFFSKTFFSFSLIDNKKNEIINLINNKFPNFKQKIIKEASHILQNQFKIYDKNVNFNKEINWNYSFFEDKSWPIGHSNRFDIRNRLGDIRYNWEFNTHSFLLPLGLAYYFTGEKNYSKKLIELLLDWINKNPVNFNSSWKSPLITSYRLISWIFSLYLIRNSEALDDTAFYKIFKSMFQHAFYISINSSKYSYNHLIGETFALFLFSYIFQDIKRIKKWYKKSSRLFKRQIIRQTLIDGVNIERTINYHRVVLEIFSLFLIIAPNLLNNIEKNLINKMYTFLAYNIKPDNSVPLVGDSDDAHIIPMCFYNNTENHYYYTELISLGCMLFNRGDLKYICKAISPMVILFTGIKGYNKLKAISPQAPKNNFHFFNNGGYFVARNNFRNDSNFFFFNMAEFLPPCGSHDHLDMSNIIYSYRGKPILVDSGSYRYNDTIEIRNQFRGFKAHNVLEIVNRNKISGFKPFCWNRIPRVTYKCLDIKDNYIFKVHHNSFSNFITSRKIVVSNNLEKIEILDRINPQNQIKKKITSRLYFHFYKNTIIDLNDREIIINKELKISFKENQHLDLKIIKESFYFSPSYGVKILTPLIIVEFFFEFKTMEYLEIKTQLFNINQ